MKLNVCTFNIRTATAHDGINDFSFRQKLIAREFPKYEADIIGFQEVQPVAYAWLEENLMGYYVVGTGRDVNFGGEHVCIAYRSDRFRLMSLDTFWLSDTPRISGSRFFTDQSSCPRICTCAVLLVKKSGHLIRVYNIHLDHIGKLAQAQGMTQVLTRIAADDRIYPDVPVILTGDFNVTPESSVCKQVEAFSSCGKPLMDVTADVGGTYHGYDPENRLIKIDYIYTNAKCDRGLSKVLTDSEDGVYLSDHYPVMAEIEI